MKKYGDTGILVKVICNRCGKSLLVENGLLKEEVLEIEKKWGYFSRKDGEDHSFDLCEACYDEWIQDFLLPPEVKERTELI